MSDHTSAKVNVRIDDPHTRKLWDGAVRAQSEVASWPAWKRGEDGPREQPNPSDHAPVMRLPSPAAPYSGDGLEVAFGPDERGQVQAYLHTGTETIVLHWDAFQASWAGRLADGRSFQVIPAMCVIARPADETAPMTWRKVVM